MVVYNESTAFFREHVWSRRIMTSPLSNYVVKTYQLCMDESTTSKFSKLSSNDGTRTEETKGMNQHLTTAGSSTARAR